MAYLHRTITTILLIICVFLGYKLYELTLKIETDDRDLRSNFVPKFIQDVRLPDQFEFCGEAVPLNDPDVRERFDFELVSNVHLHSRTIMVIKRAHRWFPQIEPILKAYHIPDDFKYLAVIESNLTNAVSRVGASGFWQFMDGTAKEFNLRVNKEVDERYHVLKATHAACIYLRKAYEKTGSWTNAAAAYNVGMRGLNRRLEAQKVTSYYDAMVPQETARYVLRILALKAIMQHPAKYGFEIANENRYKQIPLKTLRLDSSVTNLKAFAIQLGINYKLLKYHNPWLRSDKLTLPDTTTYEILVPKEAQKGKRHPSVLPENSQKMDTTIQKMDSTSDASSN